MEQALEQRLHKILGDWPPEDLYVIVAFAQFLLDHRQVERETLSHGKLSEAEHTRIRRVLDGVAALSAKTGPPVSNQDHDRYLYGKD